MKGGGGDACQTPLEKLRLSSHKQVKSVSASDLLGLFVRPTGLATCLVHSVPSRP